MSPTNLQQLEEYALRLDISDRAALAEKLLQSLDDLSAKENEQLWLAEAKRRKEEIGHGDASLGDWEEVLKRLDAEMR